MATLRLRSPLRELAGAADLNVPGDTVGEVLRGLEAASPKLVGWVLDESGALREHVVVFVNGERAGLDAPVAASDRLHVLPAISGGCHADDAAIA